MSDLEQDFYHNQNKSEEDELIPENKKKKTGDLSGLGDAGGVGVGQGGDEKNPTGFVDLEQYLQENKPETQEMISGLTSDIGKRAQDFTTQAGQAEEQFKERVDLGGVGFDKELAEGFYKAPSQFTKDKDRLKRFEKMRDAQYKGPQQFSQATDLSKPLFQQQQDILSRADLMRDRGGQQTLLSEQAKRPLTAGQLALNRALVGSTPMGVEQLQASAQQAETAARELDNQRKALNEIALRRQQETQQTAKSIQSGLTGARGSLRDTIANRVKEMRGKAVESQREFKEALERSMPGLDSNFKQIKLIDTLDEGELAAIKRAGITPEQFQKLRETEAFIENPYRNVYYRDINIKPEWMPASSTAEAGLEGLEATGRVRYVDGKPVLDHIENKYHRDKILEHLRKQEETEKIMRERGEYIPPEFAGTTYRQGIEGRDFDPSVLFSLQNPDLVYRDETVTTPEEYENLKALRELQQIQSPMDFKLEEGPDLYGVVEQVSGEKTLDEILKTFDEERAAYEQAALDRFIKENPLSMKTHSRRGKSRRENKNWATSPAAPGQGWGGGDTGQTFNGKKPSNQKKHQ